MSSVVPGSTKNYPPTTQDVKSFCEAANRGDIDLVRNYLDQFGPAIIDSRDDINARAITWAAFSGQMDVVKLLVDRGADINATGTDEKCALTWAVTSGRMEVVEYLLKKGASLDVKDIGGSTPVDYARTSGFDGMVALVDARLMEMKEYERLNGDKAKEEAARAVSATHLENLKKKQPPKLKR